MKFPITLGTNIQSKYKRHPNTGELVAKPEDIKKVTLDHKIKITRRTTGVKRNNFTTKVSEIYFNLHTNH